MDISKEKDDLIVVQATPPKQKKLKQALLPFHILSSPDPENLKNKKRKLSSSSPSGCKSEKISKLEKNESSQNISTHRTTIGESKENEKVHNDSEESDDDSKEKKNEEKNVMKPDALLKYIKRTSSSSGKLLKQFNLDKNLPVVIINRCDDNVIQSQDSSSQNHSLNNSVDPTNTRTEDSIIEKAELNDKTLLEIKNINGRHRHRGSSESSKIDNTDTEIDLSSSDDEDDNDEDEDDDDDDDDNDDDEDSKKSNDDQDEVSGKENGNNSSLEKTPKSDKNREKKLNKVRRLTPKQLEKRIESEKKKEERKKLKEEREKQRIEERMERRAKKEEQSAKREAEREQKRKEKEEKKLKKQMEFEQKQEEKERKEKAKEEEKLEAERKKQKAASTFISFFVPKNQEVKSAVEEKNSTACNFMPFEIKADMKIAPCRRTFNNNEKITFEDLLSKNNKEVGKLYLAELKNNKSKIRRSTKTWPIESKDEVIILEEEDVMDENLDQTSSISPRHRPKLLSFSENRRPPYWGTWRKKSKVVNPRRPFAKDSQYFDYDVDSDEEWEEEEPGESLHGSDDEKDKEEDGTDDYVVDNEFMVPHGYLSDEEIRESVSPETQKCKLQILKEQFEAEMKEKTAKVKPQVIGMIWQGSLNSYPQGMNPSILNFLKMRQIWVKETPIILEALANSNSSNTEVPSSTKKDKEKTPGPKKMRCPDEAVPDLIRLLHGNANGRSFLIKEFMTYWERKHPAEEQKLTQISVAKKIRELATRMLCPEKGPMYLKTCWMVSEEIRKKYEVEELTLPNKWLYELTPMRRSKVTETVEPAEKIEKEVDREKEKDQKNKEKEKKTTPLITQFTKKITQEEMKKQLSVKSVPSPAPKPSVIPNKPGKRVALISVPRGAQFPKSSAISTSSTVSQDVKNPEPASSSKLLITINDLPDKNNSISQHTDHHVSESRETCNLSGDKNSVKENQSTELNNKQEQMDVDQNK